MRDLAGQALVYGTGSAIGAMANLWLLRVYGHTLAPSAFGCLETLTAAQQILLVLCAGGLGSSLFGIYEDQHTDEDRAAVAGTALWLVTGLATSVGGTLMLLVPLVENLMRGIPPTLVRLVILQAMLGAVALVPQALNRAEARALRFVFLSTGQLLLTAAAATMAVGTLHLGLPGAIGAGTFGTAVTAVLAWASALRLQGFSEGSPSSKSWRMPPFSWRWVRPLLSFGACHVPSSIGAWITQLADRYLLLWSAGPAVVGIYGMGYRIGTLPATAVAGPVGLAWPGYLARRLRQGHGAEALCVRVFEGVCGLALGLALAVEFFSPELLSMFAKHAYGGALPIVALVLVGSVAASAQPVALSGVNLAGRYGFYPLFTAVGAVVNLALNAWWIPRAGALGAAAATAGAYVTQLAVTTAIAQRLRPVPFRLVEPLVLLALAIAALAGVHLLGPSARLPALACYGLGTLAIVRRPLRKEAPAKRPASSAG